MIKWGQKSKPKNIPRPSNNPKKSLDQKLTPKNPMPNFHTLKISTKDQPTSHNRKISTIHYSKTWMKNQFNELMPCWLQPRTLFKLLYNRFYEKMQCNATPSLNIIKPTAKQAWLSVLNIHRTTRSGYPTKSHLKSSHPQKYLSNFPTQKDPRFKNFKPKNIL